MVDSPRLFRWSFRLKFSGRRLYKRRVGMEVIWSRTSLKHFPDAIVIGVIVHQKQSPKTVNEVLKHFFAVKV